MALNRYENGVGKDIVSASHNEITEVVNGVTKYRYYLDQIGHSKLQSGMFGRRQPDLRNEIKKPCFVPATVATDSFSEAFILSSQKPISKFKDVSTGYTNRNDMISCSVQCDILKDSTSMHLADHMASFESQHSERARFDHLPLDNSLTVVKSVSGNFEQSLPDLDRHVTTASQLPRATPTKHRSRFSSGISSGDFNARQPAGMVKPNVEAVQKFLPAELAKLGATNSQFSTQYNTPVPVVAAQQGHVHDESASTSHQRTHQMAIATGDRVKRDIGAQFPSVSSWPNDLQDDHRDSGPASQPSQFDIDAMSVEIRLQRLKELKAGMMKSRTSLRRSLSATNIPIVKAVLVNDVPSGTARSDPVLINADVAHARRIALRPRHYKARFVAGQSAAQSCSVRGLLQELLSVVRHCATTLTPYLEHILYEQESTIAFDGQCFAKRLLSVFLARLVADKQKLVQLLDEYDVAKDRNLHNFNSRHEGDLNVLAKKITMLDLELSRRNEIIDQLTKYLKSDVVNSYVRLNQLSKVVVSQRAHETIVMQLIRELLVVLK